jgi:hypothetical protein
MEKKHLNKNDYGGCILEIEGSNIDGKINLNKGMSIWSHRSGWDYAIDGLLEFHNKEGVIFDTFLENTFFWQKFENMDKDTIPYCKPWVGVFHNPPNIPSWWSSNSAPLTMILGDPFFIESLRFCKGIFALSKYQADYLKEELPQIKVNVLHHPTEIPEIKFEFKKFLLNKEKRIINVGWWLRKQSSFFKLKSNIKKIKLMPNTKAKELIQRLIALENKIYEINISAEERQSVTLMQDLSNQEYDEMLSSNIVFIDLYDSSANNAVVECIARGTPLLINKLPAVIEYLGKEYPFYFDSYEEASQKIKDLALIKETNEYLMNYEGRKKIALENFKQDFKNSEIYKSL